MTTFHPFPKLPLELRIQIWTICTSPNRIIKFAESSRSSTSHFSWSPAPAPVVTRTCRESRKYCTYHKEPIHLNASPESESEFGSESPGYLWLDLSSDIVQMDPSSTYNVAMSNDTPENQIIQHIHLPIPPDAEEFFFRKVSHQFRNFSALNTLSIIVSTGLYKWCQFITETYWGSSALSRNVRFVDDKTGEWIDADLAPKWMDWCDTGRGQNRDYARIVEWEVDDGEDVSGWSEEDREWLEGMRSERERVMLKVGQRGLPRMLLGRSGL